PDRDREESCHCGSDKDAPTKVLPAEQAKDEACDESEQCSDDTPEDAADDRIAFRGVGLLGHGRRVALTATTSSAQPTSPSLPASAPRLQPLHEPARPCREQWLCADAGSEIERGWG